MISYFCAMAHHNPAALLFLIVMFTIICLGLFTPQKKGGNGW